MTYEKNALTCDKVFPCMNEIAPARERNVLLLMSNMPLRAVIKGVLFDHHCLVTEEINDVDFVMLDPFYLDVELLHIVDRELPEAPVVLISERKPENELLSRLRGRFYDVIQVPEVPELAEQRLRKWFRQPKSKCLIRSCHMTFGNGVWVCHSRAMNLKENDE